MLDPVPLKSGKGPGADGPPQISERRVFVRYARNLDVLWQFLGFQTRERTSASAVNISSTGLGMVTDRAFAPGSLLVLRVQTPNQGWASHLVRVLHCRPTGDGTFQAGCLFVKPLRPDELRPLVR